ncbi:MAG: UDP-glucose 4-epimerase GalE [Planctomycetota bacterium]
MSTTMTDRTILVVGGAGYIGSHAVKALRARGFTPVVLDNLSAGHAAAVDGVELIRGDLGDTALLDGIFRNHQIHCVMHFAALIFVGESEKDPLAYYDNNVVRTHRLLGAMLRHGVKRFIFSSSAAVYGTPDRVPIPEDAPPRPINPYGNTKFVVELLLADLAKACGLRYAALRYFNAAGADADGQLGESHDPENHLIPLVLDAAAGRREAVQVFGTDYPTPDGTCIRDYIHVTDLVDAHIRAIEALDRHPALVLNLGTGRGYSVREIVKIAGVVTGRPVPVRETARRPGDPPALVADPGRAKTLLGWTPAQSDIATIVRTAWNWHQHRAF